MEDKLLIEIWSDIACPYCYIGLHKLQIAIQNLGYENEITIQWHSYELNPSLSKGTSDKTYYDYIAAMHGETVDEVKEEFAPLIKTAKDVDLDFNLDKVVVTNTSDALRLVKLADLHNKATEVEELLFKAYFTEGKCVSDADILISIARTVGICEEEVKSMLDSDKFLLDIQSDVDYANNTLSLEYIPFYRINNNIKIQGAIENFEYMTALEDAYKGWKNGEISSDTEFKGQSCSIDGVCS